MAEDPDFEADYTVPGEEPEQQAAPAQEPGPPTSISASPSASEGAAEATHRPFTGPSAGAGRQHAQP